MNRWITDLAALDNAGRPFALVTIIRVRGSAPRDRGARMLVTETEVLGTVGGGGLEHMAISQARLQLASGEDGEMTAELGQEHDQICGGAVDLLIEVFNRGPRLVVFGAGHVGRALAQVLAGTCIRLELVDARADQLEHPEMPAGVTRHLAHGPDFVRSALFDVRACHVAVMTHSHELDLELLKALLPLAPAWLGLMGSRTKWNRFRDALAKAGFMEEQINSVECPLGLRTTGREPREIAIGLAAELLERVHAAT